MKYSLLLIVLIGSTTNSCVIEPELLTSAKQNNEEKVISLLGQYWECMQNCEAEKERITPSYYKYKKKQCALPLAQLLLEFTNTQQIK